MESLPTLVVVSLFACMCADCIYNIVCVSGCRLSLWRRGPSVSAASRAATQVMWTCATSWPPSSSRTPLNSRICRPPRPARAARRARRTRWVLSLTRTSCVVCYRRYVLALLSSATVVHKYYLLLRIHEEALCSSCIYEQCKPVDVGLILCCAVPCSSNQWWWLSLFAGQKGRRPPQPWG